jgi:hypothetical protein
MSELLTDSPLGVVFKIVEIAFIPFFWYVVNSLAALNRKVDRAETILIGADGKNGLRSRIIRLERKLERLIVIEAANRKDKKTTEVHENDYDEEEE